MKDLHLFVPYYRVDECLTEIRECLEKGWTGLGFKTIKFEEMWKKYSDMPCAHFINSATSGLHLAVRLLKEQGNWKDSDEIISSPLTFVSTNHVILYERLRPVFADVDEYLCLDPKSVEDRITDRTKAVIFVGLSGNTGRLRQISDICQSKGLKLILDAAHMAGTRLNGKHVGGEADASVFSFHAVKNLPTADSGMICFKDKQLDAEVRKWTWLGISKDTYSRTEAEGAYKWYYDVEYEGFKYHGNSIMASIGIVSLKYLDHDNAYRRQLAIWYDDLLEDEQRIRRIPVPTECSPSRHLYQIMVENRDEVMLALNEDKIFPGVHYRNNLLYKMYAYADGTCPNASFASERLISLPMHLYLSFQDVKKICTSLRKIVKYKC